MTKLRKLYGISVNDMRIAAQMREMTVTKLQKRRRGAAPFETAMKENLVVNEPEK